MSLFYTIFTYECTHEDSAVPPDSPCISTRFFVVFGEDTSLPIVVDIEKS
jgi:hypothetical protein